MRETLTREQTDYLFSLGIPEHCATRVTEVFECGTRHTRFDRLFTVTDLLRIMPKVIQYEDKTCELDMRYFQGEWLIRYIASGKAHGYAWAEKAAYKTEIADALYGNIVELIEENYLDPQKL